MRTKHDPPLTTIADLCVSAEMLYDDLRRERLYDEAAAVYVAVQDLRVRVREGKEE